MMNKSFASALFRFCLACLVILLISGCASMIARKHLDSFNAKYASGNYEDAAKFELERIGDEKADPSCLLENLQAATALRYCGKYQRSIERFDDCEVIIKHFNQKLLLENAGANIGATLTSDALLDYRGQEYEGVMVNTYKALNFWTIGDHELARIEFNRALDRQRRAKERYAEEIARLKEKIRKQEAEQNKKASKRDAPKIDLKEAVNNPEIEKVLKERYSNLYEFEAYPDFINPFTTYVAGLFFMSEGDYEKASTLLKEAYGMLGAHPIVLDDFTCAEKALEGKPATENSLWIVFENGLGPVKEEFRVDLPLLLVSDKVRYAGIALPKLKLRDSAYPYLAVKAGRQSHCRTKALASMDRVIQTEFKKDYKLIVTRAVISALLKTYAQYLAQDQLGKLAGLLAAIYQAATTSADIRMWTSLPKEFQLAKMQSPCDGSVTIATPDGRELQVTVPSKENAMLYVKIPKSGAKIKYDVIAFEG